MGWEQREEPLGGVAIARPTESPKGSLGESKVPREVWSGMSGLDPKQDMELLTPLPNQALD